MIVHQRFQGSGGLSCNTQVNTTNFKDPRIKNPGVFCFPQGRMIDRKKEVDAEFTRCYTLSPEAFKQLIAEKIERNKMYTLVDTKQRERQVQELAK